MCFYSHPSLAGFVLSDGHHNNTPDRDKYSSGFSKKDTKCEF